MCIHCTVTYLMSTMTLGTLSICMTVIILNVHHRGASQRVPAWLRRAAFVYAARLLCVNTPFAHDSGDDDSQPQPSSSLSAAVNVNVEVSPPPSPIEPVWKRRSDAKPPSPPAAKQSDIPRSSVHRDRLEQTLLRMFRRSERPPSALPTCNGCAFVADSSALTPVPARRRRSRVNGALQTRTGNGRVPIPRYLPAQSSDSTSTREEVLSPLLKTAGSTTAARRPSAVARRLDLAGGHCRSDAAWSTLDSGESSTQYRDEDYEAEIAEQYANEWRELARILDRLCFWILLVLMTASGIVILLYPKYTGSESDWGTGIT